MEIVMGALPSLIPKLAELLAGEYGLQKEVKGGIIFLQAELESMQGALKKISKTPADKLDDQDKIWARKVREMSYDIEDTIDTYMVRCKGGRKPAEQHGFKEAIDRTLKWFRQPMIRRKIAKEIREIKSHVEEVAMRRDRYKVNDTDVAKPVAIDPRLLFAQYEVKELVGIDEAREEVIRILMEGNTEVSKQHGKIVSIVGFGGLGKTTLADVVYKKIRARFDCSGFVSVSQTPDLKKLYKELLYDLDKTMNVETLDERRLIELLREFLQDKRYFVVVDDIWDISVWNMIRCALPDNDVGYTIIATTRISDVAEQAGGAYKLKPLSPYNSRKLFFRRIFGNVNKDNNEETEKCPDEELAEVSDRILKKCAGVPLAVITMASMLACKARNKMDWYEVYNSLGAGLENNQNVKNMRKILSFSYYELPYHLRTCLLYLSMFPEDFEIDKDRLIRMWIAEGFIQCEKHGKSLFELGESYFNELINRSMIQPIHNSGTSMLHNSGTIMLHSCRIHDMVLDLIRSLSSEENFVTVLSDMHSTSPSNMIRRLSLQNGKKSHVMAQATRNLLQHARFR
ncbi:disease resistance protein PIK6-NP-like [Panicum virgatum]|uniref:disease resistance protein PIK6-NP-like n=1 Tax=Panicum virgatum TaxID=38727 RepID=UPI0019D54F4A|nr:disease resistance protein PIK6-NP-like [Panicum virgatum]XP_039777672.1 disease resistance protein PIK6-NP-like [Panicum virgatum]XP_039777673.1 disease resistance protein PIK6-NP-like [Panicum virgatum]